MSNNALLGAARAAAFSGALAAAAPSGALTIEFQENLGNFPDAIDVTAEFGEFSGLSVNGDSITAPGFLFRVANTSWGDGLHSSFENDPDGDFADNDVLTTEAGVAIDNAQPFGIYRFGALLPDGSGVIVSAPEGFGNDIGDLRGGNREVDFEIELKDSLDGLIFDPAADAAGAIPGVFTNPRLGVYEFFISTPVGMTLDQILALQPNPEGIDIATRLAWEEGLELNGGQASVSDPLLLDTRLRPRGQVNAQLPAPPAVNVPAPAPALLLATALPALLLTRRRRPRASR